jgi:hypothetical protein
VEFVAALPYTETGKLMRRKLREQLGVQLKIRRLHSGACAAACIAYRCAARPGPLAQSAVISREHPDWSPRP